MNLFCLPLSPSPGARNRFEVYHPADVPCPTVEAIEKGQHMSLSLCISAAGEALESLIVLPVKTLPALPTCLGPAYVVRGSETGTGWLTGVMWREWLELIFVPRVAAIRQRLKLPDKAPALLVVDGLAAHLMNGVKEFLEENGVHQLVLPPHTSTVLQPLDLACNGILKQEMQKRYKVCCDSFLPPDVLLRSRPLLFAHAELSFSSNALPFLLVLFSFLLLLLPFLLALL